MIDYLVAQHGLTRQEAYVLCSLVVDLKIMAVATDTRAIGEAAAIAVGGTVALAVLFGGPVSGASLNPARSLGPAIVS